MTKSSTKQESIKAFIRTYTACIPLKAKCISNPFKILTHFVSPILKTSGISFHHLLLTVYLTFLACQHSMEPLMSLPPRRRFESISYATQCRSLMKYSLTLSILIIRLFFIILLLFFCLMFSVTQYFQFTFYVCTN